MIICCHLKGISGSKTLKYIFWKASLMQIGKGDRKAKKKKIITANVDKGRIHI
jgi:hypothetical protein